MQKSSGLIVISSLNQSLENRSVSGLRNQVKCAAVESGRNGSLVSTEARKKRAASQVEQRMMRDEECYSDVEEEAKEGEEEKRKS